MYGMYDMNVIKMISNGVINGGERCVPVVHQTVPDILQ